MSLIFPKSANRLPLHLLVFLLVFGALAAAGIHYYMTPKFTRVGYTPVQPVSFSHKLHSGQLGVDCRYCHSNVEKAAHATLPTSQSCMNCHAQIKPQSELFAPARQSFETGAPIAWVKVHRLPDHVYFQHAAHINRGVGCVECHGRVDQMEVVSHEKSLSMEFCIDCHRNPTPVLRPRERITDLAWQHPEGAAGQARDGARIAAELKIQPTQSCSGCHR